MQGSQLGGIDSEAGHVNGNNSIASSDRNNVRNSEGNNSCIADEIFEGPIGEKNCDESAGKGESHDCKISDDHGTLKIIQENKDYKGLTLDDCSISQLNTSADDGAVAEKHPELLKPVIMPHSCETENAAVNTERKSNLMVELKNKFVFDLDVD